MHARTLKPGLVLVLALSLFASMLSPAAAVAAPGDAPARTRTLAQGDEGTPGSPPLIEPSEDSTPADAEAGDAPAADLGDGGQPAGLPREFGLGDDRYLFDRTVPFTTETLTSVGSNDVFEVFAVSTDGPFDAVFVAALSGDAPLARYLPERLPTPDVACPTEAAEIGELNAGDVTYIFAGIETALGPDTLVEVGDSNGQTVYADVDAPQPAQELFIEDANGLLRFVIASEDGRPASLADSLAFGGTLYAFVGDVTDAVDPGGLAKLGCAGPYPVFATQDGADAETVDRFVRAGGRIYQFTGETEPVAEATEAPATEAPVTEIPATEIPPTEVPPTEIPPTEVPPTEIPATEVPPTEVPPTEIPPTEVPVTEVPATEIPVTEAPVTEVPPTEIPATEVPSTDAPAVVPADEPTEVPAEDSTEEPAATPPAPTEATGNTPDAGESAEAAGLPAQVEVQNTSYVFTQVDVDIDIQTLVEIDVVTIDDVEVTVYAERDFVGAAPVLYCLANNGDAIGQYVPVASTNPAPPAELPPTIEVENATYIFNQVNVDIDIQTLVEVNVIVVQNVELTIYVDQAVDGQPSRYYAVTTDGLVVGQYIASTLVTTTTQVTPQPTAQLQPPAFVPTQAPDAPPAAAVTAEPSTRCEGDPGTVDAQGLPARLPSRFQLGGVAYALAGSAAPGDVGELTPFGCIGAFEIATAEGEDRAQVLYLRTATTAANAVYRFEAAVTYSVDYEISGRPQVIVAAEQQFRLGQAWQSSIYSSTTVLLFASDPENPAPDLFYAVDISGSVRGDAVGEYRLSNDTDQPSDDLAAAATEAGLNPDLIVAGQRYLLTGIYLPAGTTTNGFVTLFSATTEGVEDRVLGRDLRRLELFIYEPIPAPGG